MRLEEIGVPHNLQLPSGARLGFFLLLYFAAQERPQNFGLDVFLPHSKHSPLLLEFVFLDISLHPDLSVDSISYCTLKHVMNHLLLVVPLRRNSNAI